MGFFFAASSGVILGSAEPVFSWVKFGLGQRIPQNSAALAMKIVRRIASSRQVENRRRSELGLILSGFYAHTMGKERGFKSAQARWLELTSCSTRPTFCWRLWQAVFRAFFPGLAPNNRPLAERRQNPHGSAWIRGRACAIRR